MLVSRPVAWPISEVKTCMCHSQRCHYCTLQTFWPKYLQKKKKKRKWNKDSFWGLRNYWVTYDKNRSSRLGILAPNGHVDDRLLFHETKEFVTDLTNGSSTQIKSLNTLILKRRFCSDFRIKGIRISEPCYMTMVHGNEVGMKSAQSEQELCSPHNE